MTFNEHPSGLYVYDSASQLNLDEKVSAYSFLLETVEENKKLFTRRQVRDAKRARALYLLYDRT
jgi:hypothetical protein